LAGARGKPAGSHRPRPHRLRPPSVILGTGIVEPVSGEVDVFGQIAGEIEELRVREGDSVEKGQVVAVIDARREAAAVAVAAAEAELARAELRT
jgi:HlyD family secretion protein